MLTEISAIFDNYFSLDHTTNEQRVTSHHHSIFFSLYLSRDKCFVVQNSSFEIIPSEMQHTEN